MQIRALSVRRIAWLAFLAAALCAPAHAQDAPAWPDTREARLSALALIQGLNAEILASPSATQTLQKWCGDHKLANDPRIVANVVKGIDKTPTPEQRLRLQVADTDPVRYRRVQLRCGSRVLSEADNWYVPGRLTAEMNRLLETTDTPFGTAVRALEPYRETFATRILWSPISEESAGDPGPAPAAGSALAIPDSLFEHRAVLYTRDHKPLSEVHEVYQRPILAFPPPQSR